MARLPSTIDPRTVASANAQVRRTEVSEEPQGYAVLQQRIAQLEQVRNVNIFCYRCGQDSHMATECEKPPNKTLVQEKVEARRRRRFPKN